jgi:hypothetical protein
VAAQKDTYESALVNVKSTIKFHVDLSGNNGWDLENRRAGNSDGGDRLWGKY